MNLLLDTHVLLWALLDPSRIQPLVRAAVADSANRVIVSAATAWEIAIKQSAGKLVLPGPAESWLPMACAQTGLTWIVVSPDDALAVARLPWHHRDPFDRLLIAQARGDRILVTHDRAFEAYGVPVLWT